MACADKKHGDDLGFMALGLPHSIYANQPLHQLLRINVHKQMVCKFWKRFQHLERINMCYVYIRLGHRWTRGLHGVYPPLKNSPPHPHLWVTLVTTLNPWIHEGLGHHFNGADGSVGSFPNPQCRL